MEAGPSDVMGDLTQCLHLARFSVTASFSEGISASGVGTTAPDRDYGATETERYRTLPMVSHELAALQLVGHEMKLTRRDLWLIGVFKKTDQNVSCNVRMKRKDRVSSLPSILQTKQSVIIC